MQGHGANNKVLVRGKENVRIENIEPVGHYAVQLVFDDGHDSGLYSWSYLRELIEARENLWQNYLERLAKAGLSREPDVQVLMFQP